KVVVDSGYQRLARYHASSGMTQLDTIRVTRANADQRSGRAGRMGPGVCYRLWTEDTQRSLLPANDPEIINADLSSLVLELAQWGVRDVTQLHWQTPPPPASFKQTQKLLIQLGALNAEGRITTHGQKLLELGTHPRLAHMILQAEQKGLGEMACDLAALLNEKDILVNEASSDLQLRLEVLRQLPHTQGLPVHNATLQRVRKESQRFQKQLRVKNNNEDTDNTGMLLAMAYPDRIAKKRKDSVSQYVLSNGKGAILFEEDALRKHEYLVIASLDVRKQNARVFSAASISEQQLYDLYATDISQEEQVYWDKKEKSVKATEQTRLFELILKEKRCDTADPFKIQHALLLGIKEEGIDSLPWSEETRQWQRRVMLLHQFNKEQWPDVSNNALLTTLETWLAPYLQNTTRLTQITTTTLKTALETMLDWNAQQQMEQLAPTHFMVPSGSRLRIDYCEGEIPVLKVRLQEMFGLQTSPAILDGKQALLLHLLSPAQRPIQVTQDLASFWKNTYQEVKKDLKGRYPKHYWPDDPLIAEPTNRIKRRTK
ncbi:MAG: ATP-dependent helicase HrpB, partial [Gammaproteobacteria bacterium]|nr:ATP-dependent helicase HrpB [Gammaproteobacteria bacterium]